MVQQAAHEHRGHVRAKRVLSIQFRLAKNQRKSADRSWGLSTTQDISPGGVSFYTDREYYAGDVLNIHVIMSGILDIYKGYGRVVRMERKKSGVCYLAAVQFIEKEEINKNIGLRLRPIKRSRAQRRL